jgi:hypothetical protein
VRSTPRHHRARLVGSLAALVLVVLAACSEPSAVVTRGSASTLPASMTPDTTTPDTTTPDTTTPDTTTPDTTTPDTTTPDTTTPDTTGSATTGSEPTAAAGTYEVDRVVGQVVDDARAGRVISYQVYAPIGVAGDVPVVLVSHGGFGNPRGHLAGEHLGSTFASGGFVAIHLAHDVSAAGSRQVDDRPADVTFLLDQFAAGRIAMPPSFAGRPDLDRVGHTGHSYGAYTSHAVGGADYTGSPGVASPFRDDRIDAIAPISPQGPDQFGGFVNGPDDSTWSTVTIPAYDLIGGDEVSSNAVNSIQRPGWRLAPFDHYPGTSDTFRTIIAGQDHLDMWSTGAPDVEAFVAGEILDFMRVYVAGDPTADPCAIGVGAVTSTTASLERGPAATGSRLTTCA